jgi:hypothetical protein
MKILFLSLSFAYFALAAEQRIKLFDFNKSFPSHCENPGESCLSLEDLVMLGLKHGLSARQEVQLLFQLSQNAKVQRGQLLPQANFLTMADSITSPSLSQDLVLPLLGFLFPNRWSQWGASKELSKAELQSLATLFANLANNIQHIYYDIQSQIWAVRVLNFYIKEADNLMKFFMFHIDNSNKRITNEHISVVKNIKSLLIYELANIDNLSATYPKLATAIGLSPKHDWSELKLEDIQIKTGHNIRLPHYLEVWPLAYEHSSEIKNVEHLIKAAKKRKRASYFDFIDPSSGNNMSFSFGNRIKIARSNVRALELQLKSTEMQLSNNIHNILNGLNNSLAPYPSTLIALDALHDMRDAVEKNLHNALVPLDTNLIIRYFSYAKGQANLYINLYFSLLSSQADLDRYTWNGPIYDMVNKYINKEVPRLVKEAKKEFSLIGSIKKKFSKKAQNNTH